MQKLLKLVESLKKTNVRVIVDSRIREFKELGRKSNTELFKELCFCILTANYSAERGIEIQKKMGNGFLTLPEKQLARRLKELGHRYPNNRAAYIVYGRKHKDSLGKVLSSFGSETEKREWLTKEVKGIGCKEASHFLRNTGCDDCAIIDFHIIDVLARHGLLKKPKTLTKKGYFEIEKLLKKLAQKTGLTLAELDLYLWYMETGKILK